MRSRARGVGGVGSGTEASTFRQLAEQKGWSRPKSMSFAVNSCVAMARGRVGGRA